MNASPTVGFGELLREFRERAGFSQDGLAERAHLSPQAISALERGVRRAPYRDTVALLAEALALDDAERATFGGAAERARAARQARPHAAARRPLDDVPNNVPIEFGPFVGRDLEFEQLTEAVAHQRMTTIVGAGGIGKSRIALRVVASLNSAAVARFRDGVWLADLSSVADPELAVSTVAASLGAGGVASTLDALAAALGTRTALIVLDNCEHLIGMVADLVAMLLARCPGVTVIATSRAALRIAGEAVYRLPALGVPPRAKVPHLRATDAMRYGAIELFVVRGRMIIRGFQLDDENAPVVAEIVRRLDGIALALELAAARLAILSPQQLRDRLDERFRLLSDGRRDALPRQQTLRALIGWSYTLLEERERALFRRLAIFVGGFTLNAVESVCADGAVPQEVTLEALAVLVENSLVTLESDRESARYGIAESTRAFALEVLEQCGERPVIAKRHLGYLLTLAESCVTEYEVSGDERTLDELDVELENVREALRFAEEAGELTAGARLANATPWIWRRRGLTAEGIARLEAFASRMDDAEPTLAARLWSKAAYLLGNSGEVRAMSAAERAILAARTGGDPSTTIEALLRLAFCAGRTHNEAAADEALAEAERLALGKSLLDRMRVVEARGHMAFSKGDFETAVREYERLRELRSTFGGGRNSAVATVLLAEAEHARGHTERAIALLTPLAADADALGTSLLATVLCNLAGYHVSHDEHPVAVAYARDAIASMEISEPTSPHIAMALEHFALAVALDRDYERAALLGAYCDAAFAAHGFEREFTERSTSERLASLVQANLSEGDRNELVRTGSSLTAREAIYLARQP